MPRSLTPAEIESLASRPSVRRMAVENFLSSMPIDIPKWANIANLRADAQSYRWNEPTVRAITTGIEMAYARGVEQNPEEGAVRCSCDTCNCNRMIPTMCPSCIKGNHEELQELIYLCPSCKAEVTSEAKTCWNCKVEF